MRKLQRHGPSPSVSLDTLAARAAEALRLERFKEAIGTFKLMIRQDPRPEWKQSLADAYRGRAGDLAAKSMFKEAAMVLENTISPDGAVRDSSLYLRCLIRDSQQQKAAAYLLRTISSSSQPAAERDAFEDLAAALLTAVPQLPDTTRDAPSELRRWHELAITSRQALAAWIDGASPEDVSQRLNGISLRSAFRPVRLLLRSLIGTLRDGERTQTLLDTILPGSPFFPFRQAVEASVAGPCALDADGWARLTPAQQAFVVETRGLPAAKAQFLIRLVEATRGGPNMLFGYLLKQPNLPQTEVRNACLNLLPQIPDRVPLFEHRFGPLPALERHRIRALAAEARGDWEAAERSWRATAKAMGDGEGGQQTMLSQGVIFRHLAHLATLHPELEGYDFGEEPAIQYLERSRAADPDHVPTVLDLIGRYRKESRLEDWHRLVDAAVQRFPEDSQVLLQATESAMARKAYKKAVGFARRLLKINPLNPGVRRQMIELQVAHARKQMRAKRPDLAAKELAAAAEWERSDAPSALLCIARGLIELRTGTREQAETWLRQGVERAGGGVAGWFLVWLEAELMKCAGGDAGWLRIELVRARETVPLTKEAVMTIVSALSHPEAAAHKRAVASLLLGMRDWLLQAAAVDWSAAEFQPLAETFNRFESFGLLHDFARAARQREPRNPIWRFHEIVARTRGDAARLSMAETNELIDIAEAAAKRGDFHAANRIGRFLASDDTGDSHMLGGRRTEVRHRGAAPLETFDDDEIRVVLAALMDEMPKGRADSLRGLVGELGREATIVQMIDQLRYSPLGPQMPEPVLRELAQAMVTKAMDGSRPSSGGNAQRGRC